MREILDYCSGGTRRAAPAGTEVIHEGGNTGHLFVLIEGRLEVVKGDTVVAVITEPGAVFGEMSVLLELPHTATVRAASDSVIYEFDDAASFLRQQPVVALLIARHAGAAAQCRQHLSRRSHAAICRPRHPSRDGRRSPAEHDQPAADRRSRQARIGNPTQGCKPRRRMFDPCGRPLQRRLEVDRSARRRPRARTPCPRRYRARYRSADVRAAARC